MMKLIAVFNNRTVLFILLALLAVTLLGSSRKNFKNRDLQQAALQIASESPVALCYENQQLAVKNPGVILRAHALKH